MPATATILLPLRIAMGRRVRRGCRLKGEVRHYRFRGGARPRPTWALLRVRIFWGEDAPYHYRKGIAGLRTPRERQ